jgi:hypothetical protein
VGQKKRDKRAERAARYKRAFDEIIGDPYAKPDPIEGQYYNARKNQNGIKIAQAGARTSASPVNGAKPNSVDFICDVDAAIRDGLTAFRDSGEVWQVLFDNTYITETGTVYLQRDRAELEQHIGRILVARHISPTAKYFTAIRQKKG